MITPANDRRARQPIHLWFASTSPAAYSLFVKTVVRAAVALVFATAAGCTTNDDIHTPALGAITPEHASPATVVVISGSYFCAQPEPEDGEEVDPLACEHTGTVSFNAVPGNLGEYTDTRITVEVPPLAPGVISVRVAVAGRTSNSVEFTVETPAP